MATLKCIATLAWKLRTDLPLSEEKCLDLARQQLADILDCDPHGDIYDGFTVQIDLAPMKERNKIEHIYAFDPDYILSQITTDITRRDFCVDGKTYAVKMNSDRYFVFRQNRACVSCGLVGSKMYLDINPGDQSPHFNLYGEENGRLILMTKDHIHPKSKGGLDTLDNFVTMCSICNNLKGNSCLTYSQIKELRLLDSNPDKLHKKELKRLMSSTKSKMEKEVVESRTSFDNNNIDDTIPDIIVVKDIRI